MLIITGAGDVPVDLTVSLCSNGIDPTIPTSSFFPASYLKYSDSGPTGCLLSSAGRTEKDLLTSFCRVHSPTVVLVLYKSKEDQTRGGVRKLRQCEDNVDIPHLLSSCFEGFRSPHHRAFSTYVATQ